MDRSPRGLIRQLNRSKRRERSRVKVLASCGRLFPFFVPFVSFCKNSPPLRALRSSAFIRLRRRFAETSQISARQVAVKDSYQRTSTTVPGAQPGNVIALGEETDPPGQIRRVAVMVIHHGHGAGHIGLGQIRPLLARRLPPAQP